MHANSSARLWAGRAGATALLFFFLKGLLWLGAFAVVAMRSMGD